MRQAAGKKYTYKKVLYHSSWKKSQIKQAIDLIMSKLKYKDQKNAQNNLKANDIKGKCQLM